MQEPNHEQPIRASNERAVAWARQAMAHKRAEQKKMVEDYKNNPEAQALIAELFRRNKQHKIDERVWFWLYRKCTKCFLFHNRFWAYEVLFEQSGYIFPDDPDLDSHVFELVIKLIINTTGKRTPSDPYIAATIAEIFKAFLAKNERIIVYICDSSGLRQVARARKFDGWYEYYRGIDFIKINRSDGPA